MSLSESIRLPLTFVLFIWVVFGVEQQLGWPISNLGIVPRSIYGLPGILISPFVHGNLRHLLSNTPTFFVLASSILFLYPKVAKRVFLNAYLFTGIGVWLFARPSMHIGASGLVYAFAAFLFFSGMFRRDPKSLIVSMVVAFLYNGLLYGVFPGEPGISWESHLIGAVLGTAMAWHYRKEKVDETAETFRYRWNETDGWEETGYRNIEGPLFKYTFNQKSEGSGPVNEKNKQLNSTRNKENT